MDTERRLERYRAADRWPTEEALAAMLDNQMGAFAAVRQALPALAQAVRAAAERLRNDAGRLVYVGAGASGRLAVQDGVELYPTFDWPHDRLIYIVAGGEAALVQSREGAEDDAEAGAGAIREHAIGPADVVLGIAASGTTAFTRAAIRTARERGALTIGMANNPAAPLLNEAEHALLLATGPEFLAGSTRMTAGTAQKLALNLFSTQTMTELGRVYDGLMVNVVASNAKLVERGRRMVEAITGCDEATASEAHSAAGHDVKLAVLLVDGMTLEAARRCLARAKGDLRRARDLEPEPIHET
ncbi:MAG: N-acetylmuramic acid 6-phosphate etherase [Geminicoccaceae bacterium]|jgi:N-acetylmuramic acid 6-phosphate etherase|nr:N-acetylmuramic acid 6-phosphate etherase [Geminicoccaceae bacterium]HRY27229.1 N-acetylmuramic acid 6-phosphate etherase [Geminicoccaceae bacterium]